VPVAGKGNAATRIVATPPIASTIRSARAAGRSPIAGLFLQRRHGRPGWLTRIETAACFDRRVSDAFYLPLDEGRFQSTEHTRGPWDVGSQHAGPPAALLGRAVEAAAAAAQAGMRVARMTFDIARPVPIGVLDVTAGVVRKGRSVMVVDAAIEPYIRCTAVLIRAEPGIAPAVVAPPSTGGPPVGPLAGAIEKPFYPLPYDVGYHTAMEVRFAEGAYVEHGPSIAWMRMRMPLVAGEETSPLSRVLVAADSGNGISNVVDFGRFLFVNADLSVHLLRYPIGPWVCLQSATSVDRAGIGLADTALHDEHGRIGRSVQSLLIAPRKMS
jgi:hypothetical protein